MEDQLTQRTEDEFQESNPEVTLVKLRRESKWLS